MKSLSILAAIVLSSVQAHALDMDRLLGAVAPMVRNESYTPSFDNSLREESARLNRSRAIKKSSSSKKQLTFDQVQAQRRRAREKSIQEDGYMTYGLANPAD